MGRPGSIEFIVEADVPALFFSSKFAAERALEAIDVENGEYPVAYDRHGVVYAVTPYGDRAELIRDEKGATDVPRLRKILLDFLSTVNVAASDEDLIDDLLSKCQPYLDE